MSKLQKKVGSLGHGGGAWGQVLAGGLVDVRGHIGTTDPLSAYL